MFKALYLALALAWLQPSGSFYAQLHLTNGYSWTCVGSNYQNLLSGSVADLDCYVIAYYGYPPIHYEAEIAHFNHVMMGTELLQWEEITEPLYYIVQLHTLSSDVPCYGNPSEGTNIDDGVMDLTCEGGALAMQRVQIGAGFGQWFFWIP